MRKNCMLHCVQAQEKVVLRSFQSVCVKCQKIVTIANSLCLHRPNFCLLIEPAQAAQNISEIKSLLVKDTVSIG